MPPQQHLYNGPARPMDYSISAWIWTCPPVGKRMDSVASMACPVGTGQTSGQTTGQHNAAGCRICTAQFARA